MTHAPRWIPCEERLPDSEIPVHATDGDPVFVASYLAEADQWIMLFGYLPSSGVDVTHWQPLPAPPRNLH